jgi:alpha-tubulin suppressor-like RCC1 family protein
MESVIMGSPAPARVWNRARKTLTRGRWRVVLLCAGLTFVAFTLPASDAFASSAGVYQWGVDGAVHLSPSQVTGLPSGIVAVQAGNWGGMALDTTGHVWDWGRNPLGELGNGTTRNSPNRAVEAMGPANIVSIGEGNNYAAAVDSAGNLWVWGWNADGQICLPVRGPNGHHTVRRPIEISGLGAKAVSGGGHHLIILLSNGTVDACGLNNHGQLGDGTFRGSTEPVAVKDLTNVTSVSSGNMISEALESDGSVWTWGYDKYGQLGAARSRGTPHQVSLPGPASQIYAGGDYPNDGHMMARLTDGEVMAWGDNALGQLGIGTIGGISSTPVAVHVPAGVSFTTIAAGGADSFAIDTTGGLWAWGGRPGNLGNGTTLAYASLPERIGTGFSLLSATSNEAVGYSTGP